jgi:outer membrane protein TolC
MKRLLFIFFALGVIAVQAQTILTIDEAMQIALEKNYAISIARNEGLAAKANNTAGNAGMLPDVGLNANWNVAPKDVRTRTVYPDSVSDTRARHETSAVGANVSLNWTVFDGGRMFIAKDRLSEMQALGEIRYREQVLQTLSQVISAYYNIVKLKQQLTSIEQIIVYNTERVKIAETGFNSGAKKKTDLLQAKIDLNVNRENALAQEALIRSAKRDLAILLSIEEDGLPEVVDTIPVNYDLNKGKLTQALYGNNSSILASEKQLEIERLKLSESYRSLFPRLDVSAGYFTNSSIFDVTTTGSIWPQVGANLSFPIFQSGDLRRQISLLKLGAETAQFNLENLKLQVNTQLQNALTAYETQQNLLQIEQENFVLAKENMEISLARMRLGEATSLEVRIAQNDFELSATRLVNFQYNLKMAETKLKQLTNSL